MVGQLFGQFFVVYGWFFHKNIWSPWRWYREGNNERRRFAVFVGKFLTQVVDSVARNGANPLSRVPMLARKGCPRNLSQGEPNIARASLAPVQENMGIVCQKIWRDGASPRDIYLYQCGEVSLWLEIWLRGEVYMRGDVTYMRGGVHAGEKHAARWHAGRHHRTKNIYSRKLIRNNVQFGKQHL